MLEKFLCARDCVPSGIAAPAPCAGGRWPRRGTPGRPAELDGQRQPLLQLEQLGLSGDPEVFLGCLLLLLFLLPLVPLRPLATPARPVAAAVAADEEERDDHQERQPQDDGQAHGVEQAGLVFG